MAKRETPSDLDVGEIPAEDSLPDPDPGTVQLEVQLPWLENAKEGLRSARRRIKRYAGYGLSHLRYYARLGLLNGVRYARYLGHFGRRNGLRLGGAVVLWVAVLLLSFFVLVRGSMYAYQSMGWGTLSSIGLGMFGTMLVLTTYLAWLWTRVTGEGRMRQFLPRALIAAVAGYSMYGLLYLSAGNTSLHPLMRLGASSYFLFDRNGVVTDLDRTVEDYLGMGLSMNETTLHFKLRDRYVHAMDLRTAGRSEWRNSVTASYFQLMGFKSLHHVSAADHLHVSLPVSRP